MKLLRATSELDLIMYVMKKGRVSTADTTCYELLVKKIGYGLERTAGEPGCRRAHVQYSVADLFSFHGTVVSYDDKPRVYSNSTWSGRPWFSLIVLMARPVFCSENVPHV